ncbi:MAG: GntR family transcriptional regulator [Spirochaetales bacterium]|uniref:GntR family transcriptional regulator n=1 Tax=Candidatus Thalassospirochaeta sargassi TaxID=3119039 RepID=A0AAJ1IEG4_9SPIO|nr:GntR family transcriptional regulator [Spirochaetales bacterium]
MVRHHIKQMLLDGTIGFGMKLPSEHELMKKFEVSRQTIRQAFNDLANEGLIYKQQGKGTFSNYRKDMRHKQIIAVITTYMSGFVFPGILSGIENVLSSEGYMMLLANTNNSKEKEAEFLSNVMEHNVVGVIIEPSRSAQGNVNLQYLNDMRRKGIRFVFLNSSYSDFDSSFVVMDDKKGAHMAVEHLLQLGHRRIACVYKTDDRQGLDRKEGYLEAMKAYGADIDSALIGEYDTAGLYLFPYMFAQNLLRSENRPTAFSCYNDQSALMVIQAIKDSGLRFPEDVSVVGFDDSIESMPNDMRITTIKHPKEEMGGQSARFMIDMLEGRMKRPQLVYEPELIVRDSSRNL